MAVKTNRILITIPPDLELEMKKLKQAKFYDKPHAEMYRQIIRTGLDSIKKETNCIK